MRGCFRMSILFCLALLLATSVRAAPSSVEPTTSHPHLTLSVDPSVVSVNGLVTLNISYTNVGLYHTTVTINPASALVFDPPRSMPCRYDQDETHCQTMTLRARQPGVVTIRASAHGEIWDANCPCWRFTIVNDDGPAYVTITGGTIYIPVASQE